jgi:type 1 glutamine amidotransferase
MTKKKALIVWGGWQGHTPERSATVVRGVLERNGFDVRVETSTAAYADKAIHDLSLIVPMVTMSVIGQEEVANLCDAVRGGVGLGGFHGLMCDSFRNETEYQFMTGGQWVAHPGNIIDYVVNVIKPGDPIMQGIRDFPYRSEQYYMHVDPANEVLATTTFDGTHCEWAKGATVPVVWKKHYGKGRVFFCALGHTADEFASPQFSTMVERGLLWAAR